MPEMEENKNQPKITAAEIKSKLALSYKNHKKLWKAGIAAAVIIIAAIIAVAFVNSESGRARIISIALPSSVEVEAGDEKITFYQEKNKGYSNGEGTYAINAYYFDENGEKVMLENCRYYYIGEGDEEQSIDVYLSFVLTALTKVDTIKAVLQGIVAAVVIIAVVAAIVVWYRYDKKAYQKQKEKLNRNRNNKKKK